MESLRRRADFLSVAKGRRVSRPGFVLQARALDMDETGADAGQNGRRVSGSR